MSSDRYTLWIRYENCPDPHFGEWSVYGYFRDPKKIEEVLEGLFSLPRPFSSDKCFDETNLDVYVQDPDGPSPKELSFEDMLEQPGAKVKNFLVYDDSEFGEGVI